MRRQRLAARRGAPLVDFFADEDAEHVAKLVAGVADRSNEAETRLGSGRRPHDLTSHLDLLADVIEPQVETVGFELLVVRDFGAEDADLMDCDAVGTEDRGDRRLNGETLKFATLVDPHLSHADILFAAAIRAMPLAAGEPRGSGSGRAACTSECPR